MLPNMDAASTLENLLSAAAPRIGGVAEFNAARQVFENAGYNYAAVCARLGVKRLSEYKPASAAEIFAEPLVDELGVLVRLFCQGLQVSRETVERLLSLASRQALAALDLIAGKPDAPAMDFAPVLVLPFLDWLTASDRLCAPDGGPVEVESDAVFPPLFDSTYNFVTRLPETVCEAALDLGTGSGVAALHQSRRARRVWATDIAGRSSYFAHFNALLNGCSNVETAQGDLFDAVRGLTFDRIVTQPPYMAAESSKIGYRDGGKDGEQIFRRIVEKLPEVLRRGGSLYALLMATDRENETFEQRMRKWLGAAEEQFDIFVGCDVAQDAAEYLQNARKISDTEREYWRSLYQETKTRAVLYCSVVIRRKRQASPPLTKRMFLGWGVTGRDLDFQLTWNALTARPNASEFLMGVRPRLEAHAELIVKHRVQAGRLPAEFELTGGGAFLSKGKMPAWIAQIIAECDGSRTWSEEFDRFCTNNPTSTDVRLEDFAHILAVLVSTGVFEIPEEIFGFDTSWW
jgi:SAM-dependent methyltransferase